MNRTVYEPESLDDIAGIEVIAPTRFVLPSPLRGGPRLTDLRQVLAPKGRLRFSGTAARIFADIDPGEPEAPVVALDMIARSDAEGLQRAIISALPFVDEIVVGIDSRSDDETRQVALAYADVVHDFNAQDIGLSPEAWAADEIHFANARNKGRALVKAPWVFQIDSDEYVRRAVDFRQILRDNGPGGPVGAYSVVMVAPGGQTSNNCQRLAKTAFRWWSQTHNQLEIMGQLGEVSVELVEDRTLRTDAENLRRMAQRNSGIEALRGEAEKGQIAALFHLANHLFGVGQLEEAAKFAENYRLRLEPHGPFAEDRVWIAMAAAFAFYKVDNFPEAERWAIRALLDGPRVEAFCLLGDIAEDSADLQTALTWYEIACVTPDVGAIRWPGFTGRRQGRRDGLRIACGVHPDLPGPPLTPAEVEQLRAD